MNNIIKKFENKPTTYKDINIIMNNILNGKISQKKILYFIKYLTKKKISDNEIINILNIIQKFCIPIKLNNNNAIDVCGTGGDNKNTFNISTAASFVIAATGTVVAKHGNRSFTSILGSADIFEYFGYDLNSSAERISNIINKLNIGFIFSQKFHPTMKYISAARKIIKEKTIFNLIGPLCNPAFIKNQVIGVYNDELITRLPKLLKKYGSNTIMTVRSNDGLDEISTSSNNHICLLKNKRIKSFYINTEDLGLTKTKLSDIQIKSKEEGINTFVSVLNNTAKKSLIEITAINAAAGLIVSQAAENFNDALEITMNNIKNEKSYKLFKKFLNEYGNIKKLNEVEEKCQC